MFKGKVRPGDGVIADFRGSKGVLLSTGVFWEGVNIEGSDLSQLIIFRLPFPVPADPVYEYKTSMAKNPLKEVFVPDMLLRLRQGTGRLIRSETDLGVLSILDSRLSIAAKRITGIRYWKPYLLKRLLRISRFWRSL